MSTPQRAFYKTAEIAEMFGVWPESIRNALAKTGHFRGIRPTKAPGVCGKLQWPKAAIDELIQMANRPSVASRLQAFGRPVISAAELAAACGIHNWLECTRTRPAKEQPDFFQAGGVEFLTLSEAITWAEQYGLDWADASCQESAL